MTLQICVAQLNYVVGDLAGNAQKIIAAARQAHADGARLLLTPELALCGYAAEDLYLRPAFVAACADALQTVARETADLRGLTLVVGHPAAVESGGGRSRSVARAPCHNAASVLCEGRITQRYAKRELPNYQVFDERRYFVPGDAPCVFEVENGNGQRIKVGLLICEDAWFDAPAAAAKAAGAELLTVINASPFHVGKGDEREQAMRLRVLATGLPLVYAHLVGGQDEIVFEGRSFALDRDGAQPASPSSCSPSPCSLPPRPLPAPRISVWSERSRPSTRWNRISGTRWCWACATMSARTVFPASSSVCRVASTRPWCWRSRSMRSGPTRCARS